MRNGDENLKREIRCIKLVKHENVIKLLEFINDEDIDKVYLVFELANLFSLQSLCELAKVHPIQVVLSSARSTNQQTRVECRNNFPASLRLCSSLAHLYVK